MLETMSDSRKFLLILLLACVMCIFVVQVTLDKWNFRTSSPPFFQQSRADDSIHDQLTNASSLRAEKGNAVMGTPTNLTSNTTKTYQKKPLSSMNSSSFSVRGQVRRVPLGRNPSKFAKEQLLISKQERLQEILKHSSAMRKRPTIDPRKSLMSMPVVNPSNVTRIIIITYFRAGSSFFGDLLQQNWKTFYHFEPLHSMTYDSRIGDDKIPDVFNLFDGVFKCNFSELKDYMQWVRKPRNQFLFAHNLFLWVTCHNSPKICFNPAFVRDVCVRAPVHVMKVTRLHMRHLQKYLEHNPDMNIKVVYLTRDPRGIVSSRWTLDWCNGTECSDPDVLCHEMHDDIEVFEKLQKQKPLDFVKVRYEDLSLNPTLVAQNLFRFLGLPFSSSVQKFLKTHTVSRRIDNNNPYSTRRNTSSMAFSWRERFTYKQVMDVQSHCEQVLNNLNLSLVTSPDQLPYPDGKKNKAPKPPELKKPEVITYNKNPLYIKLQQKNSLLNSSTASVDLNHSSTSYQNQISNNTNIQVHKSYKVINTEKNTKEDFIIKK